MKLKSLFLVLLAASAHAQFVGYVGLQTNYTRVINAATTTGRTQVNTNTGASFHTFTYCVSPGTAMRLIIEESPDGATSHFTQISPAYTAPTNFVNGNACGIIRVGGYYSVLAVNILQISAGNVTVWYTSTAGPSDVFAPAVNSSGGFSPVQCDLTTTSSALAPGGTYTMVLGIQGEAIYVCGAFISFNAATTAGAIELLPGQSSCTVVAPGPGPINVDLFGTYILASTPQQFEFGNPNSFARIQSTAVGAGASNDLCLRIGAITAATAISISYAQF